ncbi:MAG: GNAT family N-acetyltransferase, partial [Ruminococcus sp.]|nr:GNAT family N-acetyltransferase [Ruminococcus sp.]
MIELETRRLKLRTVNYDDVQSIFNNWASDPEVAKYVTWEAHGDISVTKSVMNYWIEEYKKENCYRYGI